MTDDPDALAAAGVPADATGRLSRSRRSDDEPVFTSDLSVNEFVLVAAAGFRPLGLVLGTSIYQIGLQQTAWNRNVELTQLSQAMYQARELAMARLQAEATALGADGVVGVRVKVDPDSWGPGVAEFTAIGTAVATDRADWPRTEQPFTSDLTGQEFWTLAQAGWVPRALVMGTCVYHVAHRSLKQLARTFAGNAEIPQFTQAVYDARELAMSRMQAEAEAASARGVVGVTLSENTHSWGQRATEFFAIGTAVVPLSDDHPVPTPQLVVPLEN